MHTTLISVIGKPGKGKYNQATYDLEGKLYETDFFFLPLLEHYHPHQFFLLGTKDSIWEEVEKLREQKPFNYQKIIIPFGVNSDEIWQIFETIVRLPLKDTSLIIDITHGFRAIPFAVFLAALYFQSVRDDVHIEDILYGNWEARDPETQVAPVVHLQSYLDMHQWIRAARRFVQYGDGDLLIQKISEHDDDNRTLKSFLTEFQRFVDNLQLTFVTQVVPQARKVLSQLNKRTKKQLLSIAPFALIYPHVMQRLKMVEEDATEWERQWRLAKWFAQNRQYTQAIIVLREMLITFTAELLGFSITNSHIREKEVGYFHTYLVHWQNVQKLGEYGLTSGQIASLQDTIQHLMAFTNATLIDQWRHLIEAINAARNYTGHALMKGKSKNQRIDPEEQIKHILTWIQMSHEVLGELQHHQRLIKEALSTLWPEILNKAERVFVIVNEGVHPIIEDLKRQYGDQIRYEVVTKGNIDLDDEREIVARVKEILKKHHGAEVVIVPSGLPYLMTLVYNTVLQITSRHPVFLQYDREKGCYMEKILDPRKLMI